MFKVLTSTRRMSALKNFEEHIAQSHTDNLSLCSKTARRSRSISTIGNRTWRPLRSAIHRQTLRGPFDRLDRHAHRIAASLTAVTRPTTSSRTGFDCSTKCSAPTCLQGVYACANRDPGRSGGLIAVRPQTGKDGTASARQWFCVTRQLPVGRLAYNFHVARHHPTYSRGHVITS